MMSPTDSIILPPTQVALDPRSLPSSDAPTLEIIPAGPLEYLQTSLINGEKWRGPLSMSQYLEREDALQNTDLTKDNQITAWILTDPNLPIDAATGTRPILSACETLLSHGYVASGGKLQKVLTHGIASVFTREDYRGKGYAKRMFQELAQKLDHWQQNEGQRGIFSTLYSDIGPKFYASLGWKVYPSDHITLPIIDREQYDHLKVKFPDIEDLKAEDLRYIPTIEYLEQEIVAASTEKPDVPHVAIRADLEHFRWHHAREELQCSVLTLRPPTIKGAIHKESGFALIWNRVFDGPPEACTLYALRIVSPPLEESKIKLEDAEGILAALMLRAQLEAYESDMRAGFQMWNPSEQVVKAAQLLRADEKDEFKVVTRDQYSLASLRWAGTKVSEEAQDPIWVGCEKYVWC